MTTPATQPSPSIPMDVAEKMYEALKAMDNDLKENMPEYERIEGTNEALSLAEKHGLGKKPNTSTTP